MAADDISSLNINKEEVHEPSETPENVAGPQTTDSPAGPRTPDDGAGPRKQDGVGPRTPDDGATPQQPEMVQPWKEKELESRGAVLAIYNEILAYSGHDSHSFALKKHETGKPYGLLDDKNVGVSISHCRSLLICGLHTQGEIGIDVEPAGRSIHPRLLKRIRHPEEHSFPEELCCIRMWTIKEAALKFLGTGLRMAMNRIKLDMTDEFLFHTRLDSNLISIISFPFKEHWIALAYQKKHPRKP